MARSTADLYDELGESVQSLPLQLQLFGGRAQFEGPVQTVRCFEDNVLVREAVSRPGDGAVLVVDGQGSLERALLGDEMALLAWRNGWAGAVIHGAIRDREALLSIDVGIKALGSNPRKSTKEGTGETGVALEFGGVRFRPGAMLYSDPDGIIVER